MSHDPDAQSRPVSSHGGLMSAHLGLVLHCTTNHGDPFNYFSNPNNRASSTWWVSDTGALEEYVDPDYRAWAQAAGNDTYNSVETSGTPDQPLTAAQIETCAHLYAWGHGHYGWPFQLANSPGEKGFGWHGMGGDAWGGHPGCPGELRKAQRTTILHRALQLVQAHHPQPAPKPVVQRPGREDMAVLCRVKGTSAVWEVTTQSKRWVTNPAELHTDIALGLVAAQIHEVTQAFLNTRPTVKP